MAKKILIGLVVVVLLIAGGAYFLFSNLDSILKAAIEKYGSEATQASVKVDSVTLSLTSGEGTIRGVVIGNPQGFASATAFELGEIKVRLDTGSATKNPILINQVLILGPKVNYERAGSGGNLEKIQENVTQYSRRSGSSSSGGSSGPGSSTPSSGSAGKEDEKKLIIEDLQIRDGRVAASTAQLPGRTLSSSLPTIQLRDIGKDKGGATPAEVAQRVIGALASESAKAATAEIGKALQNVGGAVREQLEQSGGGVGDRLRGVLGGQR